MNTQRSILVCDDQPVLRKLLMETIRTHEPQTVILEARDGKEAEELFTLFKFDVLFLDVEMPNQDGFTTLSHLRQSHKLTDCKVVMCTGCNESEDFLRGIELEADYYVTKPFDLPQIKELLTACWTEEKAKKPDDRKTFRSLCSALL